MVDDMMKAIAEEQLHYDISTVQCKQTTTTVEEILSKQIKQYV